jgi:hypothetical protein
MATVAQIPGYQYLGCYSDAPSRLLDGAFQDVSDMTVQNCTNYCNGISTSRFYPFIGVEDSTQCYCATNFTRNPGISNDERCSQSCGGNQSESCGALWLINVYSATAIPSNITPLSTTISPTPSATGPLEPSNSPVSPPHTSAATIAVSVVAGVLALVLVGVVGLCLLRRKKISQVPEPQFLPAMHDEVKQKYPVEIHSEPKISELHGTQVAQAESLAK